MNFLRSTWFRGFAAFAFLVAVGSGGYGLWYVFLRPPEAAAVSASELPLPSVAAEASVPSEVVNDGDGEWW